MKVQKVDFRKKKRKYIIFGILAVIFLLIMGVCTLGQIKQVSVVGCTLYTEEEIKEKVIKDPVTKNTLGLYATYAFGKGEEIPFVDKIDVHVSSLNSVEIVIYEKTIVACFKYMGEYLYFDKDGVVVESSTVKKKGIPIIEGVNFLKMNLYEKMEVEDEDIFDRILGISQLLDKYKIDTDKVVFDAKRSVTLCTGKIKVKLGKKDSYDEQIAELSKLLPKAKKKKLEGTLDMENFREGQDRIIFRKEG